MSHRHAAPQQNAAYHQKRGSYGAIAPAAASPIPEMMSEKKEADNITPAAKPSITSRAFSDTRRVTSTGSAPSPVASPATRPARAPRRIGELVKSEAIARGPVPVVVSIDSTGIPRPI